MPDVSLDEERGDNPPVAPAAAQMRQGRLALLCSPGLDADVGLDGPRRPREKIHRPQTRRRKEAPGEALDKMKMLRANLLKSRDMLEALNRRERKKFTNYVRPPRRRPPPPLPFPPDPSPRRC